MLQRDMLQVADVLATDRSIANYPGWSWLIDRGVLWDPVDGGLLGGEAIHRGLHLPGGPSGRGVWSGAAPIGRPEHPVGRISGSPGSQFSAQ